MIQTDQWRQIPSAPLYEMSCSKVIRLITDPPGIRKPVDSSKRTKKSGHYVRLNTDGVDVRHFVDELFLEIFGKKNTQTPNNTSCLSDRRSGMRVESARAAISTALDANVAAYQALTTALEQLSRE